jgi:hypothetical protein
LYNQEKYLLPLEQIIENFRSRFIFNNPTFAEVGSVEIYFGFPDHQTGDFRAPVTKTIQNR